MSLVDVDTYIFFLNFAVDDSNDQLSWIKLTQNLAIQEQKPNGIVSKWQILQL